MNLWLLFLNFLVFIPITEAWVVVNNEGRITFLGGLDIDPTRAGMVASLQFKKRGKPKWEISYDDVQQKSVLFVKNKDGEKVQQYNEDGKIDYFGRGNNTMRMGKLIILVGVLIFLDVLFILFITYNQDCRQVTNLFPFPTSKPTYFHFLFPPPNRHCPNWS